MGYLYRCKKKVNGVQCNARRALKRKVEDYIRKPKCRTCGAKLSYMDKHQMKKNKENVCNCGELSHPHRKGSSVWCKHHPVGPSEEDFQDRYGR